MPGANCTVTGCLVVPCPIRNNDSLKVPGSTISILLPFVSINWFTLLNVFQGAFFFVPMFSSLPFTGLMY